MKLIKNIFLMALLTGCGGGSTSVDPTLDQVLTGSFIDSAVEGVEYNTSTQTGFTDNDGHFNYLPGEDVTFNIGDLEFPAVVAASIITPIEIAETSDDQLAVTTNIARLLQSLDVDGDPSNGILISPIAASSAQPVNFDVDVEVFGNRPDVTNLVANSGSSNSVLISGEDAYTHLLLTLAGGPGADNEFAIDGFWSTSFDLGYVLIELNNRVTFYDYQIEMNCFTTRGALITLVEGNLFLLAADNGDTQQIVVTRNDDTLDISPLDTLTLVVGNDVSDLTLCQ